MARGWLPKGYSKFGNHKVFYDGIQFDSEREATRYINLKFLLKAGEISDLRLQVEYELIPKQLGPDGKMAEKKCTYIADFVYKDKDGNEVVEDVKGFRTDVYKIKKKLMRYRYGIEIQEV